MKYITTYFTSFTLVLLAIASFNWFIDPFGMFWSPQISGINKIKPEAGKRSRITKAYQVSAIKPHTLIVGNSRVEMGLDPDSPIFEGKQAYNQGMPGAHIIMQVDYALDAIANNPSIKHVIMSVDFLDFLMPIQEQKNNLNSAEKKIQSTYNFRLTPQKQENISFLFTRIKENMGLVFSLDTLSASIQTVTKQTALNSSVNSHGFNSANSYLTIMNTEGIKPLFAQKLTEISARLDSPMQVKTQSDFPFSPRFNHLAKLIQAAKDHNITVDFFINPYHYSYLQTLADKGQWSNFLLWKETLVDYLTNNTIKYHNIWDFSALNIITTEVVPTNTPKKLMQWFWEPAHYRKELGNIILKTLKTGTAVQGGFGQKLTRENIQHSNFLESQKIQGNALQWKKLKEQLELK